MPFIKLQGKLAIGRMLKWLMLVLFASNPAWAGFHSTPCLCYFRYGFSEEVIIPAGSASTMTVSCDRLSELIGLVSNLKKVSKQWDRTNRREEFYNSDWFRQEWQLALTELARHGISRGMRTGDAFDRNLTGLAGKIQTYEYWLGQVLSSSYPECVFRFYHLLNRPVTE